MGDVVVIQFTTLDGVVSDPDGRWGTGHGGWAFRGGPVREDVFGVGERMERGVQLYGRRTWEHFADLWPARDGDYARLMNAVPKRVATRSSIDAGRWSNSAALEDDPVSWAKAEDRDVFVIGSLSLVRDLAAADAVDEYRLVTFPIVLGSGERLFTTPMTAAFTATEGPQTPGGTVLTVLRRATSGSA